MTHVRRDQRLPRVMTSQGAVLVLSDGLELEIVIVDVSGQGFRVQGKEIFYVGEIILVGERVTIRTTRQSVPAEIRWAQGCEAGGIFLEQALLS